MKDRKISITLKQIPALRSTGNQNMRFEEGLLGPPLLDGRMGPW